MKVEITLLFIILSTCVYCQKSHLEKIEKKLMEGDKTALIEAGQYFDSKKIIEEFLGHHRLKNTESGIAKRIVLENTMFIEEELQISKNTTKDEFVSFVNSNFDRIIFNGLANAFIITPFEKRTTIYEIRAITEKRKSELLEKKDKILNNYWISENGLDKLLEAKNPKVLLEIASICLKSRNRFDGYSWNEKSYFELIELLTYTSIAVPNEKGVLNYYLYKDYNPKSRIIFLIFFVKNYQDYEWNEKLEIFENKKLGVLKSQYERSLFEQLNNENDSIALEAFKELTTSNPKITVKIAEEYEKAGISYNYVLPTFPYRFLKQIVVLTDYCSKNEIDYKRTEIVLPIINRLGNRFSQIERYHLENEIIDKLTLEDITAIEYWSLIYEDKFNFYYVHSIGRILDKFYSKNWKELVSNEQQFYSTRWF